MLVPDPSRESWHTISQTQTWDDGGNYRLRCTLQHADLETPFGSRSSGHLIDMVGATDTAEGFAQEREWARDCWTALAPHHAGVFVNWLMDEGEERVRQAYGNKRYERLRAVKRHYDPDNVFRLNQTSPGLTTSAPPVMALPPPRKPTGSRHREGETQAQRRKLQDACPADPTYPPADRARDVRGAPVSRSSAMRVRRRRRSVFGLLPAST